MLFILSRFVFGDFGMRWKSASYWSFINTVWSCKSFAFKYVWFVGREPLHLVFFPSTLWILRISLGLPSSLSPLEWLTHWVLPCPLALNWPSTKLSCEHINISHNRICGTMFTLCQDIGLWNPFTHKVLPFDKQTRYIK